MEYNRKVFYYETDQMGIVHHSNYIRWFEEARVEYLSKIGYPYDVIESMGIISPVLSVNCEYISMVHFGDDILVRVKLVSFKNVKFEFEYEVVDAKTAVLRAKGTTSHCFLDKMGKPVSIKKNYPELYEAFIQEQSI